MAFPASQKQALIELLKEASAALEDLPTCRAPLSDELHGMAVMLGDEWPESTSSIGFSDSARQTLERLDNGFDNLVRNAQDNYDRNYMKAMQKDLQQVLAPLGAEAVQTEKSDSGPANARLSEDAMESLVGMVEYCLGNGIAMGHDEGFASFEPEVMHPFRLELEAFCKNPKGFELGDSNASKDLKVAINHAMDILSLRGDINSPGAMEIMQQFLDAEAPSESPIKLAVHLDDGLVSSVLAKDDRARNIEVYVFDYDVESVEDDEITEITHLKDGTQEEAFVKKLAPDFDDIGIELEDIFGFKSE